MLGIVLDILEWTKVKTAFTSDVKGFWSQDFDSYEMVDFFGYIYYGNVAFELTRTCEDDVYLGVSCQLTEDEVESFGDDWLSVDTLNGVDAVADIDRIDLDLEELKDVSDEDELTEYLMEKICDYLNESRNELIDRKMSMPTEEFYV